LLELLCIQQLRIYFTAASKITSVSGVFVSKMEGRMVFDLVRTFTIPRFNRHGVGGLSCRLQSSQTSLALTLACQSRSLHLQPQCNDAVLRALDAVNHCCRLLASFANMQDADWSVLVHSLLIGHFQFIRPSIGHFGYNNYQSRNL
jgi:hypothetical protein